MSAVTNKATPHTRPLRDGLIRLLVDGSDMGRGVELREESAGTGAPVMFGHFTPFGRWTEIDSHMEGNFMERTQPGAFKKTIRENRQNIRALFQHGKDPQIGMKPLGPIDVLREDDDGPYYEVPLLDAGYVRDTILPGLRAGLYGASYKFRVMREDINDSPEPSDSNPKGLPERTIKEAQVFEFGPVTFPAYQEASAGVRSGTDDYFLDAMAHADPEFVRMAANGATFPMLLGRHLGQPDATDDLARQVVEGLGSKPEGGERMDSEDIGTLACMLEKASEYIDDQDEPDEQPNIDKMQAIQGLLIDLVNFEAAEDEPPEAEDEGENAAVPEGTERAADETDSGGEPTGVPAERSTKPVESTKAAPAVKATPLLGVRKEQWRL